MRQTLLPQHTGVPFLHSNVQDRNLCPHVEDGENSIKHVKQMVTESAKNKDVSAGSSSLWPALGLTHTISSRGQHLYEAEDFLQAPL